MNGASRCGMAFTHMFQAVRPSKRRRFDTVLVFASVQSSKAYMKDLVKGEQPITGSPSQLLWSLTSSHPSTNIETILYTGSFKWETKQHTEFLRFYERFAFERPNIWRNLNFGFGIFDCMQPGLYNHDASNCTSFKVCSLQNRQSRRKALSKPSSSMLLTAWMRPARYLNIA